MENKNSEIIEIISKKLNTSDLKKNQLSTTKVIVFKNTMTIFLLIL